MALFGTLADLPLADLVHMVESNRLSGRLTLTNKEGHGVVVFRAGKIIYAATNGPRETVGSMLVHRKLVTPSTLTEALMKQAQSVEERRLGSILLDMGAVEEETLRALMHEQVGRVLKELLVWQQGFVRFEQMELPERGEIGVDAKDFLMQEGVDTERLLFDIMTQLASADADREDKLLLDALTTGRAPERVDEGAEARSLKHIMNDIRSLQFTGEVTLNILRFASNLVARGAVFLHSSNTVTGVGQFGFDGDSNETSVDERVRGIKIPADEPSVFHDVIELRDTYKGPLEHRYWNVKLARALGGGTPDEVAVVPLLVSDQVRLLFYGDNHPGGEAIEGLEQLELVMAQAGLAIDKAVLERKLESVHEVEGQVSGSVPG